MPGITIPITAASHFFCDIFFLSSFIDTSSVFAYRYEAARERFPRLPVESHLHAAAEKIAE
jgi:hypothetical protein